MPIVEVEIVDDEPLPADLAPLLADAVGAALGAEPGGTWVRLRSLAPDRYGESGGPIGDLRPVFVTITSHRRPEGSELDRVVREVTEAVATTTGHRAENVHLLFTPDAAGRIAFGGTIRR